jgi:hypothetical protein
MTKHPSVLGESYVYEDEFEMLCTLLPRNGSLLEVGTAAGVTAAAIADKHPEAYIMCVDTFKDVNHNNSACDEGNWALWRRNQRQGMHLWVGDLASYLAQTNRKFSLAFVDADHSRDGCARDLRLAARHAKVLAVHDYGLPEVSAWPGVKEAVDEFVSCGMWRITQCVRSLCVLTTRTS